MSRREATKLIAAVAAFAIAIFAVRVETNRTQDYGYKPNPKGVQEFIKQLPEPYFRQAGKDAMAKATGIDVFLYRSMQKAHKARYGTDFVVGRQEIGSCVAWGAAHAVYVADSVSWELGEIPEPPLKPVTSVIYGGSRVEARGNNPEGFDGSSAKGGFGDGSYGAAAAKWLREWGVVYAQDYPGIFDYTTEGFSGRREKEEGAYGAGGRGDDYKVDKLAKLHPCRHVVKVETWEELCAALESGYPVTVASGQGFSSRADSHSIAEARGSWAHQMCLIGVMHSKNGYAPEDVALILNSWGPSWISYERKFPDDLPSGAFWARRAVVERMIRGDSWAIGNVDGFKWRDINHQKWLGLPRDVSRIAKEDE